MTGQLWNLQRCRRANYWKLASIDGDGREPRTARRGSNRRTFSSRAVLPQARQNGSLRGAAFAFNAVASIQGEWHLLPPSFLRPCTLLHPLAEDFWCI
jgi:hypothetical protein